MERITTIYTRVSTSQQSTRSQRPDLERWLAAQDPKSLGRIKWFTDKASGREMSRPYWDKLQREIDAGHVKTLLCWRLDRLGRNSAGLAKLIETLQKKNTRLISITENIDLASASGRLLVHILISLAAFESELKSERILAGQAVARENGKRWGGSQKGWCYKVTPEQIQVILRMSAEGEKISRITRTVNLSRSTIYRVMKYHEEGLLAV